MSHTHIRCARDLGAHPPLEKKYFQGIITWGPDKGDPYYSKLPSEIEAEAEKKVKEFMDRNS